MNPQVRSASTLELQVQARAARRLVEDVLEHAGWPWWPGLSRWVEILLVLEERAAAGRG